VFGRARMDEIRVAERKVFGNVEGAYQSLSINLGEGLYERHEYRLE